MVILTYTTFELLVSQYNLLMRYTIQVIDETDRLLREAYQSWLPTVLQLTHADDDSIIFPSYISLPCSAGSLKTIRRL